MSQRSGCHPKNHSSTQKKVKTTKGDIICSERAFDKKNLENDRKHYKFIWEVGKGDESIGGMFYTFSGFSWNPIL